MNNDNLIEHLTIIDEWSIPRMITMSLFTEVIQYHIFQRLTQDVLFESFYKFVGISLPHKAKTQIFATDYHKITFKLSPILIRFCICNRMPQFDKKNSTDDSQLWSIPCTKFITWQTKNLTLIVKMVSWVYLSFENMFHIFSAWLVKVHLSCTITSWMHFSISWYWLFLWFCGFKTLQWLHNGRHSVSNHQPQIVFSTVYFDTVQRKNQSSTSLAFVPPVNSPHKWPVTKKLFPFDDVIMYQLWNLSWYEPLWYGHGR